MIFGKKIKQAMKRNKTSSNPELEHPPILLEELFEYLLISKLSEIENRHFQLLISNGLCNVCGVG